MEPRLIYGVNAVREALASEHPIDRLYVASDSRVRGGRELLDTAKQRDIPIERVPLAKLNGLTETHGHQGVAARVSPVAFNRLNEAIASCGESALVLVLDQIQHPRNLGLMIRSAAGAGADAVVLPSRGGALIDDTVIRASAGTVFRMPVVLVKNLGQALRTLKDHDFWVYGLDLAGEQAIFDTDWAPRTVLVVGNETKGLRPGTRKGCDATVTIPLAKGLDSLNAAVAAGIGLFQVAARRTAETGQPR